MEGTKPHLYEDITGSQNLNKFNTPIRDNSVGTVLQTMLILLGRKQISSNFQSKWVQLQPWLREVPITGTLVLKKLTQKVGSGVLCVNHYFTIQKCLKYDICVKFTICEWEQNYTNFPVESLKYIALRAFDWRHLDIGGTFLYICKKNLNLFAKVCDSMLLRTSVLW